MGFVRVSGYSESDLELAKVNAAHDFEIYYATRMTDGGYPYLTYKFGKDYIWAMIIVENANSDLIWTGATSTNDFTTLIYGWDGIESGSTERDYKIKTDRPRVIYIPNVKKGDIYGRNKVSGAEVHMTIIACPYKDSIGVRPEDGYSGSGASFTTVGGFCMGNKTQPCRKYAAVNMHYGVNNNRWYMEDSADPTHVLPSYIPLITGIPTFSSSSNSGSGSSGSGGNNDPEDQEDPVNPGDPDGPTGG